MTCPGNFGLNSKNSEGKTFNINQYQSESFNTGHAVALCKSTCYVCSVAGKIYRYQQQPFGLIINF